MTWSPIRFAVRGVPASAKTTDVSIWRSGMDQKREKAAARQPKAESRYPRPTDVVELLLAEGADVNVVGESGGVTAIHLAAQRGDVAIIELLIDHGADLSAEAKSKSMLGTPLDEHSDVYAAARRFSQPCRPSP